MDNLVNILNKLYMLKPNLTKIIHSIFYLLLGSSTKSILSSLSSGYSCSWSTYFYDIPLVTLWLN